MVYCPNLFFCGNEMSLWVWEGTNGRKSRPVVQVFTKLCLCFYFQALCLSVVEVHVSRCSCSDEYPAGQYQCLLRPHNRLHQCVRLRPLCCLQFWGLYYTHTHMQTDNKYLFSLFFFGLRLPFNYLYIHTHSLCLSPCIFDFCASIFFLPLNTNIYRISHNFFFYYHTERTLCQALRPVTQFLAHWPLYL